MRMEGPHKTYALSIHGFGNQKRIDELREALWQPRSDLRKRKRLLGSDGGKEGGGSVQEKSSSSLSSETSDSTSSSDDEEAEGNELHEEEEEEPKKKKKTRSLMSPGRTTNRPPRSARQMLARRKHLPLGSQGYVLQSSTASRPWRTESQSRSSRSCLSSRSKSLRPLGCD